jgi:hypothetical protein
MKTTKTLGLVATLAAATFTSSAFAGPGFQDLPRRITTEKEAMECCLPKAHIALACKDCKTLNVKTGDVKKDVLAWFKGDSTHGCSGCGGKIAVKTVGSDKGPTVATYAHECSKCGKDSAYVCTDHKKA